MPGFGHPRFGSSATAGLSWARLAQFDLSYYYPQLLWETRETEVPAFAAATPVWHR